MSARGAQKDGDKPWNTCEKYGKLINEHIREKGISEQVIPCTTKW
jgi:hypothetical protein